MFLRRAFTETCKALDWHNKWTVILSAILAVPFAWFYLWLFGQKQIVYGEMNTIAAYAGGIVSIALIIFLVNLIRVPILIIREKDKAIDDLTQQNATFSEYIRPKLQVMFRYDEPWVQYSPNAMTGDLYTLRIAVINKGMDEAKRVRVEMIWIDPRPPLQRLVPCALHFRHDNVQPYAQETNIPKTSDQGYRDACFVDAFWYLVSSAGIRMGIWSTVPGVEQRIKEDTYRFGIKVSSANAGDAIVKEFSIIVAKDKPPTIEPQES